jgi:hypothetical protein
VEVVWRWAATPGLSALPVYQQQLVALEGVLVYGPLGHALGLGPAAAQLEDAAFKVRRGQQQQQQQHSSSGWPDKGAAYASLVVLNAQGGRQRGACGSRAAKWHMDAPTG